MNIAGTEYNLKHRALEVYISGCKPPHCPGCHNKELWDFNIGVPYIDFIEDRLPFLVQNSMVDIIWLLGGEPQDQDPIKLWDFIHCIKHMSGKPIMLWTRYSHIIKDIHKEEIDYVKLGEYKEGSQEYVERIFGITLASWNQKIERIRHE